MITNEILSKKLIAYISGIFPLPELVDWCENAVMSEEFENDSAFEIVSKIGLADVKEFGLTWEDLSIYLNKIGFKLKLELEPA
jgi:hypothetical protein